MHPSMPTWGIGVHAAAGRRHRRRNAIPAAPIEFHNNKEMAMAPLLMRLLLIVVLALGLSGCELIVDIFQAGVWMGVILVIAVIALIIWGVVRLFR